MRALDEFMEITGSLLFNNEINSETEPDIINVLRHIPDSYVRVDWPEVQELMEEDWFKDEAVLDLNKSQSYLIPINKLF